MADPVISGDDVFSHACVGASDLAASSTFYDAALAPLGIKNMGPFGDACTLYGKTKPAFLVLKPGHSSAATIIDRHGSAARGTATYEAGALVGKVLRSLFLLDYLVKPDFRREVHRNLSQGESVHQLQRAILAGRIEAKHGRKLSEIAAVSGALTLLTNIVMAWNTAAMQGVVDSRSGRYPPEHLAHIAPVAFRHINMHGKLHFPIRHQGRPRIDAAP